MPNAFSGYFYVVPLAIMVLAVIGFIAKHSKNKKPAYLAKMLLTPNELEFLGRLELAAPEMRFHAQVAMSALLEPNVPRSNNKAYWAARGRMSQKIVDYVAQRRDTGEIVAIIELDDRTHDAYQDGLRDAMTKSAGFRTIRWQSKRKPMIEDIRAALCPAETPEVTM